MQSGNAPEDRARDIHAIITALKLTHLTLVGWSQGVQDVAAYVAQYGTGALDALALVDSSVSAGPDSVKENPAFVQAIMRYMALYSRDPRAYSDGFMHAIISAPAPATTFTRLEDEFMRTPSDIGISMQMQDMFTVDRRPALKKFDKPTLVIASAASPLLDQRSRWPPPCLRASSRPWNMRPTRCSSTSPRNSIGCWRISSPARSAGAPHDRNLGTAQI